jgi:hypothetical protein
VIPRWPRTFGGTGADIGYSVAQALDGGYFVCGSSSNFTSEQGTDLAVLRTDRNGDTLWTRSVGGAENEAAYSAVATSDSGFVVCGERSRTGIGGNVLLMKFGKTGNIVWEKDFDVGALEAGFCVRKTLDGGFVIAGYAAGESGGNPQIDGGSSMLLIRTDSEGNYQWAKRYTASGEDAGSSVVVNDDGGFTVCGLTVGGGVKPLGWTGGPTVTESDIFVVRTNFAGDTLWSRKFGTSAAAERAYDIALTSTGDYIIVGTSTSSAGGTGATGSDACLLKVSKWGGQTWIRTIGKAGDDAAKSVAVQSNEGFVLCGYTSDQAKGKEFWLIATDAEGVQQWSKSYGDTGDDQGYCIRKISDGYIAVGQKQDTRVSQPDVYLAKFLADGTLSK